MWKQALAAMAAVVLAYGCATPPGRVEYIVHSPAAAPVVVRTHEGLVRGIAAPNARLFVGLPFAAPPTGELRFRPPQPPLAWQGVRDATTPGPVCIQRPYPGAEHQSEDCLTLNIYAPALQSQPRPVMVWIYGGGFEIGANDQYDPMRLVQDEDVIVVTVNYRLGALGFLAHPALRGGGEGAYAIMDQQAALRWVRDNIGAFGGDAGNVTLFGESSGAWSVCYQLTSPGAKGLFHKAILQSGPCTSPNASISPGEAETGGETFAAELGCSDPATAAACLRSTPSTSLRNAKPRRRGLMGEESWSAMDGGDVLPLAPRRAFEMGRFEQVPVIDGTNHDEGRLFVVLNGFKDRLWEPKVYGKLLGGFFGDQASSVRAEYAPDAKPRDWGLVYADVVTDAVFACPALTLNALLEAKTKVFAYEFDDPNAVLNLPPAPFLPPLGAYHSAEITYVFQTRWIMADPAKFSPSQRALSDRMRKYWGSFARTGDPNEGASIPWRPDDRGAPLRLAPTADVAGSGFRAEHHCKFWNAIGY